MRRKSILLAISLLALAGCGVLAVLALMARHEPEFYRRVAVPPGAVRKNQSRAFKTEFTQLISNIASHDVVWTSTFTEAQLNSFFAEDFIDSGCAEKLLPEDVREPRVVLEQDKIRLAFRYGTPPWSTIISIEFRVWLAPRQYNVVVLELQSLHAGSLPISAQSLLEQLSDTMRRHNIDVTWYRHKGNPAAVLRFGGDQARPSVQMRRLEVHNGTLTIVGGSVEPAVSPPGSRPSPAKAPSPRH
jgi:hypothetical protein